VKPPSPKRGEDSELAKYVRKRSRKIRPEIRKAVLEWHWQEKMKKELLKRVKRP